jgi:hypothetical protein
MEGVVMISDEQYERLVGKAHQPRDLLQFFRESPLVGVDLDLERCGRVSQEGFCRLTQTSPIAGACSPLA